eukprot:2031212-Pyramimonas_sp.AAC.1
MFHVRGQRGSRDVTKVSRALGQREATVVLLKSCHECGVRETSVVLRVFSLTKVSRTGSERRSGVTNVSRVWGLRDAAVVLQN